MSQDTVTDLNSRTKFSDELTDLLRKGAQSLLRQAIEDELKELLVSYDNRVLPDGRRAVVRNGYQPERPIQTGIGPVEVKVPKIRSKDGDPVTFHSALVPPYVRKTKSMEAALPWLYLKGVSTGEMENCLSVLVGPDAKGLSAATVARLKKVWSEDYGKWSKRSLGDDNWAYIWADGIYSATRGKDSPKLCVLAIIGVNDKGEKHFLSIEDGVRESTQSWREVLLNMKSRGFRGAKLGIGDGAMGFWAALEEIFPETSHQRCWMHKTGNVLNCLPKSSWPKAKDMLHEIWQAETKENGNKAFDLFLTTYQDKYPKAAKTLLKDRQALLNFFNFPAIHWRSIRTTNPIESTFGTIRHRTQCTKGAVSRETMLTMIFKLGICAEKRWKRLRGFDHLAKVIDGVKFINGIEDNSLKTEAA